MSVKFGQARAKAGLSVLSCGRHDNETGNRYNFAERQYENVVKYCEANQEGKIV